MRTFVIRARKGTTRWERLRNTVGGQEHFEVIAHSILNAFFLSNDFRKDVEMYIVLDSSEDFPRTIRLSSNEGLSLSGFHEEAILETLEKALKDSQGLQKNETRIIAPGLSISGFGFEKLIGQLLESKQVYLLEPKGIDIGELKPILGTENCVFILSDHLALPSNIMKSLKRRGLKTISLGKKMLFASQCVTLIHYELDR